MGHVCLGTNNDVWHSDILCALLPSPSGEKNLSTHSRQAKILQGDLHYIITLYIGEIVWFKHKSYCAAGE